MPSAPGDERETILRNEEDMIHETRNEMRQQYADMNQKLMDMNQKLTDMNQTVTETSRLMTQDVSQIEEINSKLEEENKTLGKKIDDMSRNNLELQSTVGERESQILSLQPYRQELTVSEANSAYEKLVDGVKDFVESWTSSILQNDKLQAKSLRYAQMNKKIVIDFKEYLTRWKDLYNATLQFHDIDQEILVSFILRFLQESIFETGLYNLAPNAVDILDKIEFSMNEAIKPKPDAFAVKSWRAQACLAIVKDPGTHLKFRSEFGHKLSTELASLLGFIGQEKNQSTFMESIQSQIIDPALSLHEKFLTSTNDFRMGTHISTRAEQKFDGEAAHLSSLECTDIASNHRKFLIGKLKPIPTIEQLREQLYIICSACPALIVIEFGRGQSLKDPYILCKEEMLVAWIPDDKSKLNLEHDSRSWLHGILEMIH
ncbi:hypothetical protein F4781DRAFT_431781 [Annulohypoxylon bovei var. microspora]|nr:hypothetical protein F4781DRAFT_431781 [Annulohypoxylon bovei var. microspora]